MIEVDHLCKRFGALTAVDDISFNVAPGEILGFLGPNGAGKSTTMKMLTGFLSPTGGRVSILGHDITLDTRDAQRRIGYLPEGAPSYDEMTPRDFLMFIAEVREIPAGQRQPRIDEVVATLSLTGVLDQRIETLSKGFKRRVGLAQAILHDPDVLILDEPTDGLDPNQKHQVRQLIQGLSKDKIVIISTHILEEVTAVCTRAIIIAAGKVVVDCTPEELEARSPHHGAITLTLADDDAAAAAAVFLADIEGVTTVTADGATVQVMVDAGQEVMPEVLRLLAEQNVAPMSMYKEHGRLDEVFREVTGGAS